MRDEQSRLHIYLRVAQMPERERVEETSENVEHELS